MRLGVATRDWRPTSPTRLALAIMGLMVALQRSGRSYDARRIFAEFRARMAEETELDPSTELCLHHLISWSAMAPHAPADRLEGPDGSTVRIAGHGIATDITAVRRVGRGQLSDRGGDLL